MTSDDGNVARIKLAVLVTCFNRVAVSERGLVRLDECLRKVPRVDATLFVVDDGSPDGTGARLKERLPDIVLEYGDGNLFWNGGMCRAFEVARRHGHFDAYLLFNDDVLVEPEGISAFFDEYVDLNRAGPAVLAGPTRWHANETISYSAFRRLSRTRPMNIERFPPDGSVQRCDTFNGNFVAVPGDFFEQIGGLDRKYRHSYGDIDLGYVANARGVPTYLASSPVGRCDGNAPSAPKGNIPRWLRWVRPWGKGDDLAQRVHFIRKHAPIMASPLLIGWAAFSWLSARATGFAARPSPKG